MKNDQKDQNEHIIKSDQSLPDDLIGVDKKMWEAMHFDFEVVEEPPGLKDEVMNFVFEQEDLNETHWEKIKNILRSVRNQFTPLTASLSSAMLICIILLSAVLIQSHPGEGFSEVVVSMKLNHADEQHGEVYGYAFLINKSGTEELVINVFDFPQTEGKEVYQVWLIEDGHRQSAGVFRPNKEGFGVLTVNTSKFNPFDNIGITLEPDAKGKQPRGVKIVGT